MVEIFIQSLIIAYSGSVMPGSLLAYTVERSLKKGAATGLLVSIGHAVLELLVVVFLMLGVAKFLDNAVMHKVVGAVGGSILLYIGAGMVRKSFGIKSLTEMAESNGKKHGNLVLGGFLLSASNPYFIIWWAAIGLRLVTEAYSSLGIRGAIAFYFGHILADISWYVLVSVMLSKTKSFISVKVYRSIILALGVSIILFGIRFILFAFTFSNL